MSLDSIYELLKSAGMKFSTDTRKINTGDLFFALKGGNFNGNLFAQQALESGASYAIVDELLFESDRLIKVDDVLTCLQQLSSLHRTKMKAKVIGIGGSNGKTTTKELMVSVFSLQYNTHYTHGNLNNHIGVPLTLLGLKPEHEIAIIELGTNRAGDIKELCDIALPEYGLITNIGKEHLEGFGSIEGVARAESELYDYLLKHDGLPFVNADDTWLDNMSKRFTKCIKYSVHDAKFSELETSPKIQFNYSGMHIKSVLPGIHNFQNIAAVIAVAEQFEVNPQMIKTGIESYVPSNNRSQFLVSEKANSIMLDAYNANPSSVEMALKVLEGMNAPRVAILGDMFELGAFEAEEHKNIRDIASQLQIDEIVLVGKAFSGTGENTNRIHCFEDKSIAIDYVIKRDFKNYSVLLKGSRGMKMEDFLPLV
ncbi:MAG TPA: UDP-N-acetylmuramoyl-tripeptide--D-alanyl-D-alanine ligase [Bacteroidia bacterium]